MNQAEMRNPSAQILQFEKSCPCGRRFVLVSEGGTGSWKRGRESKHLEEHLGQLWAQEQIREISRKAARLVGSVCRARASWTSEQKILKEHYLAVSCTTLFKVSTTPFSPNRFVPGRKPHLWYMHLA